MTTTPRPLQPLLHDSVVQLRAPSQMWSADDGDAGSRAIHGFYHSDVRILDRLRLTVGGLAPEAVAHSSSSAASCTFTALARNLDDATADPRVRVDRRRSVGTHGLDEEIVVTNALAAEVRATVEVTAHADFTAMHLVKAGLTAPPDDLVVAAVEPGAGEVDAAVVRLASGTIEARIAAPRGAAEVRGTEVTLSWEVTVPPRGASSVGWTLEARDASAAVGPAEPSAAWSDVRVRSGDSRLASWVSAALRDLQGLRMVVPARPDDVFLAAGAPWFFTLFGRDSIWAARMLLPFGTELAASTLRVLASLQGTHEVAETAEQPGKIMHELRPRTSTIPGEGVTLPPLYYGTVDATALWIVLLHDAWRWGMPDAEVEALLPQLEAALVWMRDFGDSDGDGFLEYVDSSGQGLANQGWKDSGDSIQWRDGTLAEGPIALCEVQGYAYEAAMDGATLLDRFGRSGAPWRRWAGELKRRFAASFWVDDPAGAYPAVALDARKRRVDTVTSNIGHLLGTGILEPDEAELVASRVTSPELDSGFGLRTMSSDSSGFWPLSYHGGSVWAHDTAVVVAGLRKDGFVDEARSLADGLLRAADGFGYRVPELYAGDSATTAPAPVPYPAACRPQAWSAAASVAVLSALLGLDANAQTGELGVKPAQGVGPIEVDGLRFAGRSVHVGVDAEGTVDVS